MRDHYGALIAKIPATRLLTPDADIWAEAGLIAGTLARTQGYQRHQRKECLNDALIYLTAAKAGLPVLTSNRDEFDLIQQLAPQGRFLHF
jgi:predicted nucleic acid-binding protein